MQKALSILELLSTHLPEVKRSLGKRWPIFADQMRAQATSFENLTNEESLMENANQLLGLFMMDETTQEILTRPSGIKTRYPHPKTETELSLDTIANRFYELCVEPDYAIKPLEPTKDLKSARTDTQPKESSPKRKGMND